MSQDRLDLAETAKYLAQRMSDLREFELKRAARYLVGNRKALLRIRRQKHVDKSQSPWTATLLATSVEEEHVGIGGSSLKSGAQASELDSFDSWRGGVLHSGERMSSWTIFEIYLSGAGNSNEG